MKVLFLDFDGVLHPTSATKAEWFCRAELLADSLAANRCHIVISSSWRFSHSLAELKTLLPADLASRVIGTTGAAHVGRFAREQEIKRYVRSTRILDWAALDDCAWDFEDHRRLILCDANLGFAEAQAQAMKIWFAA